MKVLVGAYACEPDMGSEPGVGWNWSLQAARHGHEVHVITRANNRAAIEGKLRSDPVPNLTFHYLDLPEPILRLKKQAGQYGILAYYYLWQLSAWRLARWLHRRIGFDVAHHVTFVNDWMPSGVAGVPVPFIWGPVGGSTHIMPKPLRAGLPASVRRYEMSRRLLQNLLRSSDPFLFLTRRRACVILTYTREALAGIPPRARSKAIPVVHIGISEFDLPALAPGGPSGREFTVLTGGRLVHWKGFDLLIRGFAQFVANGGRASRLNVIGQGPFRPFLENLVRSCAIEDQVRFLGWLPSRDDVYEAIGESHLYALPTLRDGPPVAILEAMFAARPILCLDVGAPRELVPDGAGFKIEVQNPSQVVRDVAETLAWASTHREALAEMGARARDHARSVHDWSRIGDRIEEIYRRVASVQPSE